MTSVENHSSIPCYTQFMTKMTNTPILTFLLTQIVYNERIKTTTKNGAR